MAVRKKNSVSSAASEEGRRAEQQPGMVTPSSPQLDLEAVESMLDGSDSGATADLEGKRDTQLNKSEDQSGSFSPEIEDDIEEFFDQYEYASPKAVLDFVDEVSRAITGEEQERGKVPQILTPDFQNGNTPWEEQEPEPDLVIQSEKYLIGKNNLRLRIFLSAFLAVLCVLITVFAGRGVSLPFGLGKNRLLITGALLLLQIASASCGLDLLWKGITSLFRAEPNAESLLFFSGLFTLVDGVYSMLQKDSSAEFPYSAVFCVSVSCFLLARYYYRTAMSDAMKAAASAPSPLSVICDVDSLEGRAVLKKQPRRADGFYRSIMREDYAEKLYRIVSPLFLIGALALAALASIGKGNPHIFPHFLAGELAVAVSFFATLSYAMPFRLVTSSARKAGAVIAGWGGAETISSADSAVITDEDLFPPGTVGIENAVIYGDDKNKAITYAASLIIASGSGLSRCFADLLRQQKYALARVYDFTFCESGGVRGKIRGETAMVGSSGFMNLMGIRIPAEDDSNSSVYLAVGKALYARFDVTYVPANTVQSALMALMRTRFNILFAVRDFNISPASVRKKFKVPVENLEHMSISTCYTITESTLNPAVDCAAVLTREGLAPFAAAIAGGNLLRNISSITTILSVASSLIGMLLLFALFWLGPIETAGSLNVLTYLFINGLASAFLSLFARNS